MRYNTTRPKIGRLVESCTVGPHPSIGANVRNVGRYTAVRSGSTRPLDCQGGRCLVCDYCDLLVDHALTNLAGERRYGPVEKRWEDEDARDRARLGIPVRTWGQRL